MERAKRASLEFSLLWESKYAYHTDRIFIGKVDFWRDIFPGQMLKSVSALFRGEKYTEKFEQGTLVPPFEKSKIYTFGEQLLDLQQGTRRITPRIGRFYPRGIAWRGLNSFKMDLTPFRLVDLSGGLVVADTNHPLSHYQLKLQAKFMEQLTDMEEHGGGCNDLAEAVTENGPGMQIPYEGIETDFYSSYPFPRKNREADSIFYRTPRMINHLDEMAASRVKLIYSRCLSPGMKILDLMSSCNSHLPDTLRDNEICGLGMNADELQANPQLHDYIVHDLNKTPVLPFKDNDFDAVICTGSIEYLIHPLEVMSEIARITKPDGIVITTFSDRWFPGKEILPWSDMHHFERQGYVLDLYLKTSAFDALNTESIRGLPRPVTDPHRNKTGLSDPIFAVWGTVKR